ncbi:MAG TPA: hypothetical protein VE081_07255 [Sporichthyaceae bacterium]|nr:hypothetical protein [Sporichthyaceae bacterium]
MDRRLRAALEGGGVLVLTAVVAVVVDQRESVPMVPAKVSLVTGVGPGTVNVHFLVRGGGCDSHAKGHLHGPTVQYRTNSIDVKFRMDEANIAPCPGADPGFVYTLTLVTPLGERTLRDSTAHPPTSFPIEPAR